MRLYIHCCIDGRDHVKEVHDITLREGYIPTIGHGHNTATMKKASPLDPEFTPAVCKKNRGPSTTWHIDLIPLEPALWFKVNIVDVIVIDCKDRCVRWNTESATEKNLISSVDLEEADLNQHFRGLSMAALNSGDCYDYEADLDQLIENSHSLMSDYIKASVDNKKFNEIVLKLLHCHVLPIIALSTDDIPKLKETLEKQKQWITKADNDILNRNQKLDGVQGAINKQCEQYIKELKETKRAYPSDFAKVLKSDLDYSIQLAQDNLNDLQCEVDKMKSRVSDNTAILEEKRQVRDQAHETYQNMVKAREHLQELLHSAKRGIFNRLTQKASIELTLQNIYVGLDAERKKFLNDILMLSHRKVLLLSVREAIHWTMEEIESQGASFGLDSDGTGRKSFDVLRHSVIPIDWKPMSEQVYSTVRDRETGIGKEHHRMVKKVMDQVNRAFYEAELQESSKKKKVPTATLR